MKQTLHVLLCAIILLLLLIPLKLFIIGEPVDRAQLIYDVQEEGNTLRVNIPTPSSAMALRGVKVRQEGSSYDITVRKVLVSSLFPSGSTCVKIDLLKTDHVYLGGKLIWSSE